MKLCFLCSLIVLLFFSLLDDSDVHGAAVGKGGMAGGRGGKGQLIYRLILIASYSR